MLDIIQDDYSGGMNLFSHSTKLAPNEYGLSFNILNRTSALEVVKDDVEDILAPIGFKQGIFAFDKYLVTFVAGLCYYRNVDDTAWTKIDDLFVNPSVNLVFAQAVPASTFNFKRKLDETNKIDGTGANTNVTTEATLISTTNSGLVVQDGISQGWFISPTAVASRLNRFSDWTLDNRSYVPIMRQMAFMNGILLGIAPDKKRIFRSVSGRPLDFVVNVNKTGNRGGDATTTAYAVGYNDINCLKPLNSGELLVGTAKNLFPIEFNYDKTIFQEPTFLNRHPLSVGITNQESFIDILGDYAFIDFDGLRSFNAVSLLTNEGRNSVFSILISKVFQDIKQVVTETACIVFNNFAYFSFKTIYGNVLAVYDTLRQKWSSFIQVAEPIKQFAVADESENPTLYGITDTKVLKLFQSTSYREAKFRPRAISPQKASEEIKLQNVRAVFDESTSKDQVTVTEIINNKFRKSVNQTLASKAPGILIPVTYPISYYGSGVLDDLNFNFQQLGKTGWKLETEIRWSNSAKLLLHQTQADEITNNTAIQQQASNYIK